MINYISFSANGCWVYTYTYEGNIQSVNEAINILFENYGDDLRKYKSKDYMELRVYDEDWHMKFIRGHEFGWFMSEAGEVAKPNGGFEVISPIDAKRKYTTVHPAGVAQTEVGLDFETFRANRRDWIKYNAEHCEIAVDEILDLLEEWEDDMEVRYSH